MILAFTGHRLQKMGGFDIPNRTYNYVCAEIERLLKELQPEKTISGMAIGVDQIGAEICIKRNIPFIAAVPFEGQELIWPIETQKQYHKILQKAAEIVIVSPGGYSARKMQIRNEWMIDHADAVLSVWNGLPGGTANATKYAQKQGKLIYSIDPGKAE